MNFRQHQRRNNQQITTTYVKPSIINLMNMALADHKTSLLNLGQSLFQQERE